MRALCSKSLFHVFSVKTPTRLAKKDIPRMSKIRFRPEVLKQKIKHHLSFIGIPFI